MRTRSLLVRFPGYPGVECLLPDAQLAGWAAALKDAGHRPVIVDYGTVDMLGRLIPSNPGSQDRAFLDLLSLDGPIPPLSVPFTYWRARHMDRRFTRQQQAVLTESADLLGRNSGVDMLVFRLETADDVGPALFLASRIKSETSRTLICGAGPFVESFGPLLGELRKGIDVWVLDEPEVALPRLASVVHRPESWTKIPNLCVQEAGQALFTERRQEVRLSQLPPPAYDLETYPALGGYGKIKLFTIEDSRGAPPHRRGHMDHSAPLQLKPASQVVGEMRRLATHHGARTYHFSSLHTPASHARAIARELLVRGLQVRYSRSWTPDGSDPGVYDALRASGCAAVGYHVCTGSERLLADYFGAGWSVSETERVLRASKAAGLFTCARLVYPTPADDYHTEDETLRLIRRTCPDAVAVAVPELAPRSAWYENAQRYGFSFRRKSYMEDVLKCRAKFPLPPHRWPSLPYRLGRWSGSEVIRRQEQLILAIKGSSVVVYLSEVMALLSCVLGSAGKEFEFHRDLRRLLPSGDLDGVARLVTTFNEHGCVPAKPVGLQPFVPSRAAVGN